MTRYMAFSVTLHAGGQPRATGSRSRRRRTGMGRRLRIWRRPSRGGWRRLLLAMTGFRSEFDRRLEAIEARGIELFGIIAGALLGAAWHARDPCAASAPGGRGQGKG